MRDSMSDDNGKQTCSSWLMYYLGSKHENEFVTTAVKLGYPMLIKKIEHITTTAIWQESIISKKSQIIVLRYLSNFFSTRLVVTKYCIDKLGQKNIITQIYFFFSMGKQLILDETQDKVFNYIT